MKVSQLVFSGSGVFVIVSLPRLMILNLIWGRSLSTRTVTTADEHVARVSQRPDLPATGAQTQAQIDRETHAD